MIIRKIIRFQRSKIKTSHQLFAKIMKTVPFTPSRWLVLLFAGASLFAYFTNEADAQITAQFTGGNSADEIDAYNGKPGLGWKDAWGRRRAHPTSVVNSPSTVWGESARLQIVPDLVDSGSKATEMNVYRTFESFNDPVSGLSLDIGKQFSISFSFSIDDLRDFTASPTNYFLLAQGGNETQTLNPGPAHIWYIMGFGGTNTDEAVGGSSRPGALQGQWNLYNGKTSSGTYVPTGIALEEGVLYTFVLNLNPASETYSVSISNGVDNYESGSLVFNNTSGDMETSTRLFFGESFAPMQSGVYSLGEIAITQIPEPSTAFMIFSAACLGWFGFKASRGN